MSMTFPAAAPTAPTPMTINQMPDAADWLAAPCGDKLRRLRQGVRRSFTIVPGLRRSITPGFHRNLGNPFAARVGLRFEKVVE